MSGEPKAIKILKSSGAGSNTYIYAEARTQYGEDAALAPGVILHTGVDTTGSEIYEVDLAPTTSANTFLLEPWTIVHVHRRDAAGDDLDDLRERCRGGARRCRTRARTR